VSPHATCAPAHTQAPAWQLAVAAQVTPHAPQPTPLFWMSTHAPRQSVSPAAHAATHAPDEHTWPRPQIAAHAPQWLGSLLVSTQCCAQRVWPAAQVQLPAAQDSPGAQALSHAPQWRASLAVSTQCPLHAVPAAQLATQLPASQDSPAAHARSQPPQLSGVSFNTAQTSQS
jgi:hypothetical protein